MTEGPCSRASSNIITGCKYCSRDLLFIWEQSNERRAAAPASAGMPMAGQQEPAALGKAQPGLNVCLPLQTWSFCRKKCPGWLAKLIPAHGASAGSTSACEGLRLGWDFGICGSGQRLQGAAPWSSPWGTGCKSARLRPPQGVTDLYTTMDGALRPSLALLVLPGTAWSIPALGHSCAEHPCASSCTGASLCQVLHWDIPEPIPLLGYPFANSCTGISLC